LQKKKLFINLLKSLEQLKEARNLFLEAFLLLEIFGSPFLFSSVALAMQQGNPLWSEVLLDDHGGTCENAIYSMKTTQMSPKFFRPLLDSVMTQSVISKKVHRGTYWGLVSVEPEF